MKWSSQNSGEPEIPFVLAGKPPNEISRPIKKHLKFSFSSRHDRKNRLFLFFFLQKPRFTCHPEITECFTMNAAGCGDASYQT